MQNSRLLSFLKFSVSRKARNKSRVDVGYPLALCFTSACVLS